MKHQVLKGALFILTSALLHYLFIAKAPEQASKVEPKPTPPVPKPYREPKPQTSTTLIKVRPVTKPQPSAPSSPKQQPHSHAQSQDQAQQQTSQPAAQNPLLSDLKELTETFLNQEPSSQGHSAPQDGFTQIAKLNTIAQFTRFYLDVPFGLAQKKAFGRATAQLIKGHNNAWSIFALEGDPYFAAVLHQALSTALTETQVLTALQNQPFAKITASFNFMRTSDPKFRLMPLYNIDGHKMVLNVYHQDKVECINNQQDNCDKEIAMIENSEIFQKLANHSLRK